uniref:Serine/threonine-protein phosphatase 2A activator n=1 Tax=Parastrongyloides trichosuri TaxID=131310 RepID=A0A0N4ZQ22_PARTI
MSGEDNKVGEKIDDDVCETVEPYEPVDPLDVIKEEERKMSNGFFEPRREITKIFDVGKWHTSKAYKNYMDQLKRLNNAVKRTSTEDVNIQISENVQHIIDMLFAIEDWINEFPPENMELQRFGNKAFRQWHEKLKDNADRILSEILPKSLHPAIIELKPYLLDSFGNSTRIDYGTGHEAAFLIFILCLYKLGFFTEGFDDKAVVLRLFRQYISLTRQLQTIYRMEPAGSKGVHALDDFSFAPFIFGSAQLLDNNLGLVPDSYIRDDLPVKYADHNLFFEAIEYINTTKNGPFFEHSNQLWNISAVQTWEKVNSGLFKMYEAEVLKKFPVCQHFLFGSLFSIEKSESLESPFRFTNAKLPQI